MQILDGKVVSEALKSNLKPYVSNFHSKTGRPVHLVVLQVGENPASSVYVRNKIKACELLGMKSSLIKLPIELTQADLEKRILELNKDPAVDAVLVQLPLPPQLSEERILEILDPAKDADGFTFTSMGYLWSGKKIVAPCTPQGVMTILKHYGIDVAGMNAVVIGRSQIVGKPMTHLLSEANATVTMCHSKTKNLRQFTLNADLVVVAAGKRHLLGKDDFRKDSIVIDVGIHGSGSGQPISGDVRFAELDGWVKAATPVPGGVGPMTIATLLENSVKLAYRRAGLEMK